MTKKEAKDNDWYWVNIYYACGGIRVGPDNLVNKTPPIFRWMKGKSIGKVVAWVNSRAGQIEKIVLKHE